MAGETPEEMSIMSIRKMNPITAVVGTVFAASFASAALADTQDNPFGATDLDQGYDLLAKGEEEGKCGEGKCGEDKDAEGKCGEGKDAEGKCGEDKDAEGKCGEGKCGEGKCGEGKDAEGKCGEGKCGGAA
jgi:uncharacterized low-complexity protein